MQAWARGSIALLCCFWLSLATVAVAADEIEGERQPPANDFQLSPSSHGQAGPGHDAKMATCLSVANDPAATLLWEKSLPERPNGVVLVAWLADREQSVKAVPGFDTLHACAQVIANDSRPLFEDQAYLREGAVTSMDTCRTIADDLAADLLWQKLSGHAIPNASVAGWLAEQDLSVRKTDGFGTLLACAQVVAAWHSNLPDRSRVANPGDGRVEHGVVVLDLELEEGERGAISAQSLVRLFSSPGLIPRPTYGGIVLRNARVDGTLLFYNLNPTISLAFVNVEFSGSKYSKSVFNGKDTFENTAISVQHSNFDNYMSISDSTICGDATIIDSSFAKSILVEKTGQTDCLEAESSFDIFGSRFEQTLNINRSELGALTMDGNTIDSFFLSGNLISPKI